MNFSERMGIIKPEKLHQEDMPLRLRNLLWTVFIEDVYRKHDNHPDTSGISSQYKLFRNIWINFLEESIDEIPSGTNSYGDVYLTNSAVEILKEWFYNAEWHQVLGFVEFIAQENPWTIFKFNHYLSKKLAAFRFIGVDLVPISSEEEIKEIETALESSDPFTPVKNHLQTAIDRLSDFNSPDYRNSVKESICAVESLVKILLNQNSGSLGELVKKLDLPQSLQKAIGNLYGYTSNEGGIRHGLKIDSHEVNINEARFMLITCSAIINYLISKSS